MGEPCSVTHHELAEWPKEAMTINGFAAERRLLCDWDKRFQLMAELMNPAYTEYVYPYNNSGAVVTHLPEIHNLRRCKQSEGAESYLASYEKAVLVVNYSTQAPLVGRTSDGLLVSEWTEGYFGYEPIDHRRLQWGEGANAEPVNPQEGLGKVTAGMRYVLMYHCLPAVPNSVMTAPGSINSNAVATYLLGITFAKETLLYRAPQIHARLTTGGGGGSGFQVKHSFLQKWNDGLGWNSFWNPTGGANNAGAYEQVRDQRTKNVIKPHTPVAFNF